jgi:hypothetical protein
MKKLPPGYSDAACGVSLAAEEAVNRSALAGPLVIGVLLVAALAVGLVAAQPGDTENRPDLSLSCLSQRADRLSQITNPIEREEYCVGLSAVGMRLDKALAPDARVFMSGMLGKTNAPKGGYYFFFRNYLFPRDVEISLNTNVVCLDEEFKGTPCDSPAKLQADGFDLLIRYDNRLELIPLTRKGLPK